MVSQAELFHDKDAKMKIIVKLDFPKIIQSFIQSFNNFPSISKCSSTHKHCSAPSV